ncbi:hypothetical protein GQ53DRAFT_831075 [Thozetella sp. PMI_491]|nr:hypothetical protein GQ53DRAFT_831075 [Thozetella sp. PMI_491]
MRLWQVISLVGPALASIAGALPPPEESLPPDGQPTIGSPFVQSDQSEPPFEHNGPIERLPPGVHWSVDTTQADHLRPIAPSEPCPLYYGSEDPCDEGYFGFMTYYFNHSAVILDHSSHVNVVHDLSGTLNISCAHPEAFETVAGSWNNAESLILISSVEGCGSDHDRCFFHVESLRHDADALTIVATGAHRDPETIMTEAEAEWGYWIPRSHFCNNGGRGQLGPRSSTSFSNPGPASPDDDSVPVSPTTGSKFGSRVIREEPSQSSIQTENLEPKSSPCAIKGKDAYGLPKADIGSSFDDCLDKMFGDVQLSNNNENQIFVDVTSPEYSKQSTDLAARAPEWPEWLDKAKAAVSNFVKNAGEKIVELADKAVKVIKDVTTISKSLRKDLSFKLPDPTAKKTDTKTDKNTSNKNDKNASDKNDKNGKGKNKKGKDVKQVKSPWGDDSILLGAWNTTEKEGTKTSAYLKVFCVGCGIRGNAVLQGKVSFNLIDGFKEGYVEVNASLTAGLKIGVDAKIQYENKFGTELFSIGLPGLSWGVVTIGPKVTLLSELEFVAKAEGRLLAGAELGILAGHARLDIIHSDQSASSGWKPEFKPVLEAEGSILVSASLALPLKLGIGISIPKFEKSLSLVSTPSLKASAAAAASLKLDDGAITAGFKDIDGCKGVNTKISWRYKLELDLFSAKTFGLYDTDDNVIAQNCIEIGGSKSKTPDSVTAPPSSQPEDVTDQTEGKTEIDYDLKEVPAKPYNQTDRLEMTTLIDPDASVKLVYCEDRNVYVVGSGINSEKCSELWTVTRDTVVRTGTGGILHYYKNTMEKLGVSRVRLSYAGVLNGTLPSVAISFILATDGNKSPSSSTSGDKSSTSSDSQYLAVDSLYEAFGLLVCTYDESQAENHQGARLFLAKNLDAGVKTLQSEEVMESITGGKVTACYPLPIRKTIFVKDINNYQRYMEGGENTLFLGLPGDDSKE